MRGAPRPATASRQDTGREPQQRQQDEEKPQHQVESEGTCIQGVHVHVYAFMYNVYIVCSCIYRMHMYT